MNLDLILQALKYLPFLEEPESIRMSAAWASRRSPPESKNLIKKI